MKRTGKSGGSIRGPAETPPFLCVVDASGGSWTAMGRGDAALVGVRVVPPPPGDGGEVAAPEEAFGWYDPRSFRFSDLQRVHPRLGVSERYMAVQSWNDWEAPYSDLRDGESPFGQPEWWTAHNRSTREADGAGRVALPCSQRRILDSEDGKYALALTLVAIPVGSSYAPGGGAGGAGTTEDTLEPPEVPEGDAAPGTQVGAVTITGDIITAGGIVVGPGGTRERARTDLAKEPAAEGMPLGTMVDDAPDPVGQVQPSPRPGGYVVDDAKEAALLGTFFCPALGAPKFSGREGTTIRNLPARHDAQIAMSAGGRILRGRRYYVADEASAIPDHAGNPKAKPVKGEMWHDATRANKDTELGGETGQFRPVVRILASDIPAGGDAPPPKEPPKKDPDVDPEAEGEKDVTPEAEGKRDPEKGKDVTSQERGGAFVPCVHQTAGVIGDGSVAIAPGRPTTGTGPPPLLPPTAPPQPPLIGDPLLAAIGKGPTLSAGHDAVTTGKDTAGSFAAAGGKGAPGQKTRIKDPSDPLEQRERLALLEDMVGDRAGGKRTVRAGVGLNSAERVRLNALEDKLTASDERDESIPVDAFPEGRQAIVRSKRKADAQREAAALEREERKGGESGRNERRARRSADLGEKAAVREEAEAARQTASALKRSRKGDTEGAARARSRAEAATKRAEQIRADTARDIARFEEAQSIGSEAARTRQRARDERAKGEARAQRQEKAGDPKAAERTRAETKARADRLDDIAKKQAARRAARAERASAARAKAQRQAEEKKTKAKRRGSGTPEGAYVIDLSDPDGHPVLISGRHSTSDEEAAAKDLERYQAIADLSSRSNTFGHYNVANYPMPIWGTPGSPESVDDYLTMSGYQTRAMQDSFLALTGGPDVYGGNIAARATQVPASPAVGHELSSEWAEVADKPTLTVTSITRTPEEMAAIAAGGLSPGAAGLTDDPAIGFGSGFGIGVGILELGRGHSTQVAAGADARPLLLLKNDMGDHGVPGSAIIVDVGDGLRGFEVSSAGHTFSVGVLVGQEPSVPGSGVVAIGRADHAGGLSHTLLTLDSDGAQKFYGDDGSSIGFRLNAAGDVLQLVNWDAGGTETSAQDLPGGGGAADFTDLGDVPASYTGHGTKFVKVNAAETGLEFVAGSGATQPLTDATAWLESNLDGDELTFNLDALTLNRTVTLPDRAGKMCVLVNGALSEEAAGGAGPIHTLAVDVQSTESIVYVGATGESLSTLCQLNEDMPTLSNTGSKWGVGVAFRADRQTPGAGGDVAIAGSIVGVHKTSLVAGSLSADCSDLVLRYNRYPGTGTAQGREAVRVSGQHRALMLVSGECKAILLGSSDGVVEDFASAGNPPYPAGFGGLYFNAGAGPNGEGQLRLRYDDGTKDVLVAGDGGTTGSAPTVTGQVPVFNATSGQSESVQTYANPATYASAPAPTTIGGGYLRSQSLITRIYDTESNWLATLNASAAAASDVVSGWIFGSAPQFKAVDENGQIQTLCGEDALNWLDDSANTTILRGRYESRRTTHASFGAAGMGVANTHALEDDAGTVDIEASRYATVWTSATAGSATARTDRSTRQGGTVTRHSSDKLGAHVHYTAFGGTDGRYHLSQELTVGAGTTLDFTGAIIPKGAKNYGAVALITDTLGNANGLTAFSLGDGTDADRWGQSADRLVGTDLNPDDWTALATEGTRATAAITPRATSVGGTGFETGVGKIRVEVWYEIESAPTS